MGELVRVGPREDFIVELVELLKLISYGERALHRISGACWVFGEKGPCSKATQLSLCLCVSGTLILVRNSSRVFFKKNCNAGLGWLLPAEPTAMNKLVMAGPQGDSRVDPRPMPCWVSGRPVKMVLVGGVGKGLNTETLVASLQLSEAVQFSLSFYDSSTEPPSLCPG